MKKLIPILFLMSCEYDLPKTSLVDEPIEALQQIDKSTISVVGTGNRDDFPITNTIDDSQGSFMVIGTVYQDDSFYLAYKFDIEAYISSIEIIDNYTNAYNIGDAEYYVSSDSTDGIDGSWEYIRETKFGDINWIAGNGSVAIDRTTRWVKMVMTYRGTGAMGMTPAFYISEINFYK